MLIQTPCKSQTSTSTRRRPTRRRPCLEALTLALAGALAVPLQGRCLASSFVVLNLADSPR